MIFEKIDIDSKELLDKFLEIVDYEACEYCFTTLYMWQHVYNTEYYIDDKFAVVVGEYEGDRFSVMPLASKENLPKAIEFIIDYFKEQDKKIYLRATTKEVVELLKETYKNDFEYIEERDFFDYVYDGESLRTLSGRKNQKKRNHLNYFLKEYEGRFEYKLLQKEDFDDCIKLLKEWKNIKEENNSLDDGADDEFISINRIFDNYNKLDDKLKICGVYIDNKLEAFSMGEYINSNMALIHIEKANQEIRGLYQYINQQFLVNEFSDVEFVNREEDLGIEGLRKAKLSYHPIKFVEKYTVISR
ncbi:MAG: DUF2156 domain-containing protein [Peptostreptococcaceae bacterium]